MSADITRFFKPNSYSLSYDCDLNNQYSIENCDAPYEITYTDTFDIRIPELSSEVILENDNEIIKLRRFQNSYEQPFDQFNLILINKKNNSKTIYKCSLDK